MQPSWAELVIVAAAFAAVGLIGAYTVITGISPMPSSARARAAMMALLPPDLEGPIVELGAGWGTLALPLARRCPRCPVLALELSPVPWLVLRLRQAVARLPNLTVRRADFHQSSLTEAAAVVCYLYPGAMARLRPKLEAELPPGCLVVSNSFAVPGWSPARSLRLDDLHGSRIYLYRISPAGAGAPGGAAPASARTQGP